MRMTDVYPDDACAVLTRDNGEKLEITPNTPRRYIHDGVPSWFVKAMKRAFPDTRYWESASYLPGKNREAAVMAFLNEDFKFEEWQDHYGWEGKGERSRLICEPYYLHDQGILNLQQFCQRAGLHFTITGFSSHYPSKTIRIMIHPEPIY